GTLRFYSRMAAPGSLATVKSRKNCINDAAFRRCSLNNSAVATKTPEQWLEEASPKKEALLKLFLGYAPGVGKTYSMLSEAIRRHSRGEDVVVSVVETHGRKPITELAAKLPTVDRRKLEYKGAQFEEMDVDAILARKPAVAVIDE